MRDNGILVRLFVIIVLVIIFIIRNNNGFIFVGIFIRSINEIILLNIVVFIVIVIDSDFNVSLYILKIF